MEKKVTALILLIITIVIIFSIIGATSTNLITGAEAITDANNCSESSDSTGTNLVYNITDKNCYNSTTESKGTAGQYDLPLNTLFSASGIVMLILMAVILIVVIKLVLIKKKGG